MHSSSRLDIWLIASFVTTNLLHLCQFLVFYKKTQVLRYIFLIFVVLSTSLVIVYFTIEYDKLKLQLLESVIKALCFFHLIFIEVSSSAQLCHN